MLDIVFVQNLFAPYPMLSNPWIQSLVVLIFFIIVSKIFAMIANFLLAKVVTRTKTDLDDKIVGALKKPISNLLIFIGAYLAFFLLQLPETYTKVINNIIVSFVFLVVGYAIVHVIDLIIDSWGKTWAKKTKSTIDDHIIPLIHKFSKYGILIIVIMLILDKWGVQIGPFIASLGIAGIAIGFAVKDSLANIFGGLSLILDKTFKVGDRIKLESGEIGTIIDIGLRSTRMKTFDNDMIIIPNGELSTAKIYTYNQPNLIRKVKINFGVEYGNKPDKIKKLVLTEIKKMKDIRDEPAPNVLFMEMAASALIFRAQVWVDDYRDSFSKKLEMTERIYNILNKHKIVIPFDTQTIYVKKD